jgi:hypothetical protein
VSKDDADQLVREISHRVEEHKGVQVSAGFCFGPSGHVSKEVFDKYCSLNVSYPVSATHDFTVPDLHS